MFHVNREDDVKHIDAVKQNILDEASNWNAKIDITGKSIIRNRDILVLKILCKYNIRFENSGVEKNTLRKLLSSTLPKEYSVEKNGFIS